MHWLLQAIRAALKTEWQPIGAYDVPIAGTVRPANGGIGPGAA